MKSLAMCVSFVFLAALGGTVLGFQLSKPPAPPPKPDPRAQLAERFCVCKDSFVDTVQINGTVQRVTCANGWNVTFFEDSDYQCPGKGKEHANK